MKALIRKEVRLMFPAWIVAMLAAVLPALDYGWTGGNIEPIFAAGLLILSLSAFGLECSFGTFSLLLTQPQERRRLWRVKVSVLIIALLSVLPVLYLSSLFHNVHINPYGRLTPDYYYNHQFINIPNLLKDGGLFALLALSGGLWATLFFRQMAAAFWFALLVPGLIWTANVWLPWHYSNRLAQAGLMVYAVAGFFWARWQFLRAQDVTMFDGTISLPGLSRWLSRSPTKAHSFHPIISLFRKELQLQQVTFILTAVVMVLHIAAIIRAKKVAGLHDQTAAVIATGLFMMWSVAIPGMVGCAAVAEERKLKTMEGLLCLPMRRWMVFTVKLFTVLLTATVLGVIVPYCLNLMAKGVGLPDKENSGLRDIFIPAGFVAAISFYASTITRNLLQAIGAAIILPMLTGTAMNFFWRLHIFGTPLDGMLMLYVTLPLMGLALIHVCYGNYQRLQIGWRVIPSNMIRLIAAWICGAILTIFIFQRTWEFFMPLEPKHGAARLSGPVRPGIWKTAQRVLLVLLPDGRLWADIFAAHRQTGNSPVVPQKSGAFLSQSNWVSIATTFNGAAGVQSDGTLWKIKLPGKKDGYTTNFPVEQIGFDSDWKIVAAGLNHFLAMKVDGSIWGWGLNHSGQLGPTAEIAVGSPTRLGTNSDWVAIFASTEVSFAVNKDGSVWGWGIDLSKWRDTFGAQHQPRAKGGKQENADLNPVRLNFQGTNWVSMALHANMPVALRSDGTLWADASFPITLFGEQIAGDGPWRNPRLMQIGYDSDWRETSPPLVALKKDGTLLMETAVQNAPIHPSKYSDWIAVTRNSPEFSGVFALAADGTISVWEGPEIPEGKIQLLPSRRPVFSLNIFK